MAPVTPLAKKRFFQSIHAMEKRVKSEGDGAWHRGSPCVEAAVAFAHPRGKVDRAIRPATDADTRRLDASTESTREDTEHSSKQPRQPSLALVEADLKHGHREERAGTPQDASKGDRVSEDAALSAVAKEELTLRAGGREDQTLPESQSPEAVQMNPDKVASEQGNKFSQGAVQRSKALPLQNSHTEEDECQLANAKAEQLHSSARACPAEEPAAQLRSPVVVPLQEDRGGGEHCATNKALTDYSGVQCFSPLAAWHVNAVHKGWAEVSPWAGSEAPLSEEQAPLGTQVCLRSPLNPVTLVFSNAPNSASPAQPSGSTTPGKSPAEEQASENPAAISFSECTDVSSPFVRHATIGSLGFSSFGLNKSNGGTPTNSLLTPSGCVGTPSSLSLGFGFVALESPAGGEPLRRMALRDDTPGSEAAQTSSQRSLRGPCDSVVRDEKPGASSAMEAAVAEKMAVDGLAVAESDAGRGVYFGEAADGQMRPSVSFVAEGELGNIEEGVGRLGFGTMTRCERVICEEEKGERGRAGWQETGSLDVKGLYRVLGVAEESMGLTGEGGELRGAKVKIGRGGRIALAPINGGPRGVGRGRARDGKAAEEDSWDDDRKGGGVLGGFGEVRLADAGCGKAGSLMERRMEFVDEWIGKFSKEDVEPFRLASLMFAREVAKKGSVCGGVLGDMGLTFEETIWCEILKDYGLMAEGH